MFKSSLNDKLFFENELLIKITSLVAPFDKFASRECHRFDLERFYYSLPLVADLVAFALCSDVLADRLTKASAVFVEDADGVLHLPAFESDHYNVNSPKKNVTVLQLAKLARSASHLFCNTCTLNLHFADAQLLTAVAAGGLFEFLSSTPTFCPFAEFADEVIFDPNIKPVNFVPNITAECFAHSVFSLIKAINPFDLFKSSLATKVNGGFLKNLEGFWSFNKDIYCDVMKTSEFVLESKINQNSTFLNEAVAVFALNMQIFKKSGYRPKSSFAVFLMQIFSSFSAAAYPEVLFLPAPAALGLALRSFIAEVFSVIHFGGVVSSENQADLPALLETAWGLTTSSSTFPFKRALLAAKSII